MAKAKKKESLTPEERLQAALVPESEQPYPVPENWCWTYFKPISKIRTGKKDANYGSVDGEYPFFTCAVQPIRCHGYSFDCNAILLAGNGDINNISRYRGKFEAYQRTYVVEIIEPINIDYVFYWFKYRWFDFNKDKMFGTAIPYIRLGNLQEFPIPVSPLAQQQRIVDRIESLFAKLDEAKQKAQDALDSFETRKAAILHKAFTGELTAQWRKEHGVGMESWETKKLSEVSTLQTGLMKGKNYSGKTVMLPYLRVANVQDGFLNLSEIKEIEVSEELIDRYSLKNGDVLFTEGGDYDKLGRGTVWQGQIKNCLHQNHVFVVRPQSDVLSPYFLSYQAGSRYGKQYFLKCSKQTTNLASINSTQLKGFPVLMPTIEEQAQIVLLIDDLLAKEQQAKEAAEGVLEQIDLIKKSILARAFRGELGTNDPGEESAVELVKRALSN